MTHGTLFSEGEGHGERKRPFPSTKGSRVGLYDKTLRLTTLPRTPICRYTETNVTELSLCDLSDEMSLITYVTCGTNRLTLTVDILTGKTLLSTFSPILCFGQRSSKYYPI